MNIQIADTLAQVSPGIAIVIRAIDAAVLQADVNDAPVVRVGTDREFPRNGYAGHDHVFGLCAARHQTGFRLVGRHAVQVHGLLHPERVRFEVRDHTDRHRIEPFPFQMRHDFHRQVMGADHRIRLEPLQILHKFFVGPLGEPASQTSHLAQPGGVVGLFEDHAPQLRCVFDQFHVALDVNPPLQA